METTKELAARNRRAFLASVNSYLAWGLTAEEQAEHAREDAAYLAQRAAEYAGPAAAGELLLRDERIEERMRARDRAFDGGRL